MREKAHVLFYMDRRNRPKGRKRGCNIKTAGLFSAQLNHGQELGRTTGVGVTGPTTTAFREENRPFETGSADKPFGRLQAIVSTGNKQKPEQATLRKTFMESGLQDSVWKQQKLVGTGCGFSE